MDNFKRSTYYKAQEKHKCLLYYFKIYYEINKKDKLELDEVTFVRDFTNFNKIKDLEE